MTSKLVPKFVYCENTFIFMNKCLSMKKQKTNLLHEKTEYVMTPLIASKIYKIKNRN